MKPSFALDLTDDGIALLHRTARGWMDVGSVGFSEPDLAAALDYLRATALGLSPTEVSTKLVIPNSQIRYFQIYAPGPDADSRRAQIAAALEGLTPYDVADLAFDWSGDGPQVTVAVVARETLAEAEAFAAEHRFNPVSFVAKPDGGFDGEPFFGATSLLPAGSRIEPDAEPISVVARDLIRADVTLGAQAAPVVATEPALGDPAVPNPDLPTPDLPEPELPRPEPEQPEVEPQPEPLPEPVPKPAPEPWQEPDLPTPTPAPPEVPAPEPVWEPDPPAPDLPGYDLPAYDPTEQPMTMTPPDEAAEAPMAVDVPLDEMAESTESAASPASVLTEQAPPVDDLPSPPPTAAFVAFASRRAATDGARALGSASLPEGANMAPELGSARPKAAITAATAPLTTARPSVARPAVDRPAAARPAPKFSYDDPVPSPPRLPGDPPAAAVSMMGKAGKGLRTNGNMVTSPTIPGSRKKKAPSNGPGAVAATAERPAPTTAPLAMASAVAAATGATLSPTSPATARASRPAAPVPSSTSAFGKGLGSRPVPQRGKPRYLGLILTGVLLLLLALVAAWSSFVLTRAEPEAAAVQVSAAGTDTATGTATDTVTGTTTSIEQVATPGDVPDPDDEMLADGILPDDAQDIAEGDLQTAAVDEPLPAPEPAMPDAGAQTLTGPEAVQSAPEPAPDTAIQAEAASVSQPSPTGQDEIFLAGMDAPPALSDPFVLPQPTSLGDSPPAAQMPPPPFGTVYQFDENGRIKPTPDGIMTPEGVMLVAGKPPRVPPQRPAPPAATAAAASAPESAAMTDAGAAPQPAPAADPALSGARPRARPAGIAPDATEDDAALANPAIDSRFASLRPRLRAPSALAAGEAARRASQAASLAVQSAVADAAAEAVVVQASASPMAIAVSRKPAPRPRDLSRAVEEAVAAATRQPEARAQAEPEVIAAAAPAPKTKKPAKTDEEADDEPEVRAKSAAPRIPTKASVAKQATYVNAINLSKTNLIGVYGTDSKRYALIRLSNGKYKKVKIGDSVDGGRVQAITKSEVRYQKSGKMLTLAMPKG
ncbi:MAG: hypothetical protein JXR75_04620 [Rhodobacteraceae bacterium]|nr:hypothetical protein [Paracoccaceae bacterium]